MTFEKHIPKGLNDRRHFTSRHRLRGFDYSNPGYYFVTICINNRINLLGRANGDEVLCSDVGLMVTDLLDSVPMEFPGVEIDCFVVMPNHIHAILYLPLDGSQ